MIQCLSLSFSLTSLGMITSGCICVLADAFFCSFFKANILLYIYMYQTSLSIPLSMDIYTASMSWLLRTVLPKTPQELGLEFQFIYFSVLKIFIFKFVKFLSIRELY